MAKTRRNPLGSPAPKDVQAVRVGSGLHTHVYHPWLNKIICSSGKNAGRHADGEERAARQSREQEIFRSEANFITCYRCQKLLEYNLLAGRPGWMGPYDNRHG